MRAGDYVVDDDGRWWICRSVTYVPWVGIRIHLQRPRSDRWCCLSDAWPDIARVVRR